MNVKECLHKEDKSSNIKDFVLEKLLSYIRNKIIAEKKQVSIFFTRSTQTLLY